MATDRIGFIVQKPRGAKTLVTVMGELVKAEYKGKKERVVLITAMGQTYKEDELEQCTKDLKIACSVEGIDIIKLIPVRNARYYYESKFQG